MVMGSVYRSVGELRQQHPRPLQLLCQPRRLEPRGSLLQMFASGGRVAAVAKELTPDAAGAGGFKMRATLFEAAQAGGEVRIGLIPTRSIDAGPRLCRDSLGDTFDEDPTHGASAGHRGLG